MNHQPTVTAFAGERLLVSGSPLEAALSIKAALKRGEPETILAFDDRTGRQVDFDLRGSDEEIAARLSPQPEITEGTRRGRPKRGVVAREVTLLPRHWEWLAEQPGGASVTLRKLVDAARQSVGPQGSMRQAQEAEWQHQHADEQGSLLGDMDGGVVHSPSDLGAEVREAVRLEQLADVLGQPVGQAGDDQGGAHPDAGRA